MLVTVSMAVLVLVGSVDGSFVNGELHAFDFLPFLPIEVEVKVAEGELREFPFEGGRFDAEVD